MIVTTRKKNKCFDCGKPCYDYKCIDCRKAGKDVSNKVGNWRRNRKKDEGKLE